MNLIENRHCDVLGRTASMFGSLAAASLPPRCGLAVVSLWRYLFVLVASLGGSDVHRNDVPTGGSEVMFTGGYAAVCMVQRMMWLRRDVMTITNIEVTQLSSIQCFNVCLLLVRRRTYQQWLDTKFPSSIKPLVYVLPCRCYRPNNTA